MSDANAKTVTLPLVWGKNWGLPGEPDDTLRAGPFRFGQVINATEWLWFAYVDGYVYRDETPPSYPDRASARQALEDAVLAMGVASPDAADPARLHDLLADIGASLDHILRGNHDGWDRTLSVLRQRIEDSDMAREGGDVG